VPFSSEPRSAASSGRAMSLLIAVFRPRPAAGVRPFVPLARATSALGIVALGFAALGAAKRASVSMRLLAMGNHHSSVGNPLMLMLRNSDLSPATGAEPKLRDLLVIPEMTARELVQLFKLLADQSRLRIVHFLLQQEELNVTTLCGLLAQSQPAVSHHLALMREAGVLGCRRDGKHNYYRLVPTRCREYLDLLFARRDNELRKLRIDEVVLTYGRDGQPAAPSA
jgi:DNA-binding transcriptional ArsR family regulator